MLYCNCLLWLKISRLSSIGLESALLPDRWQATAWINHYGDVIMGMMASQITSITIVYSTVYSVQIKENIKAPRHWPLCGEFTGDRWIPRTKDQWRGKCFHLMTSSWMMANYSDQYIRCSVEPFSFLTKILPQGASQTPDTGIKYAFSRVSQVFLKHHIYGEHISGHNSYGTHTGPVL